MRCREGRAVHGERVKGFVNGVGDYYHLRYYKHWLLYGQGSKAVGLSDGSLPFKI